MDVVIICLVGAWMHAGGRFVANGFAVCPNQQRAAAFGQPRSVVHQRSSSNFMNHAPPSKRTSVFDSNNGFECSVRESNNQTPFSSLRMSADDDGVIFVKADDLEALQALFAKECDAEGLMTKAALESIPAIAELLVRSL